MHVARLVILKRAAQGGARRVRGRDRATRPAQQGSGRYQRGRHHVAHRSTCPRRLRTAEMPSRQPTWPRLEVPQTSAVTLDRPMLMSWCTGQRPPSSPRWPLPAAPPFRTAKRARSKSCWRRQRGCRRRRTTAGRPRYRCRLPGRPGGVRARQQVKERVGAVAAAPPRQQVKERVALSDASLPDNRSRNRMAAVGRSGRGAGRPVAVELQDVR